MVALCHFARSDDLFKPLDVHFARNHTIANLLALYPSRRLPAEMVTCIWRHYFECFLAPLGPVPPAPHGSALASLAPTALPSGGSSSGAGANPWRHSPLGPASAQAPLSPSLSVSSAVPPAIGAGNGDDLAASTRAHGSFVVAGGGGGSSNGGGNSARALVEHSSFGHSSTTTPKNSDAHQHVGCGGGGGKAAAGGGADGDEDRIEIACMQRLLTDILRHDLACLKERYDEVLAASLAMPPEEDDAAVGWGGGRRRPAEPAAANGGPNAAGPVSFATFDPAPVLRALRGDLQRLNNMPIDYLARVALREMKGGSEEDLAAGGGAAAEARKGSLSLQRQHSALLNAPNSGAPASGAELSPLDRPALPALPPASVAVRSPSSRAWVGTSADAVATPAPAPGTGLSSTRSPLLLTSPSSFGTGARSPSAAAAAPLPPLSFELFASAVDFTLRNLLDRFYRKGWWILFSLNLVHNARKVYAAARCPGGGGGGGGISGRLQPRSSRGGGSSGTWGDRIGAAAAVVALDAERASAVKLRKTSLSASVHTPVRPLSGQAGGPGSPGVGPVESRAATPSQVHAPQSPPPPVLPVLRTYRSSLSRSGAAGGALLPPPLPSGSPSAPPSPGAAVASFKLPPLLVIRNDNTLPGPAPLTALSADSLSPSSSHSSASFAFGTLAGGGGGGGGVGGGSLHSPGQSPPQSGTLAGAPPAGFGAMFPSPSSNGRTPLRQQPPDEQTPSLAAIQEIV